MRLNTDLLEMKKEYEDGRVTYQCPSCAEEGHDNKGEHLIIYPDGQFGCAAYQGETGKEHRKRIFELVGERTDLSEGFKLYPKIVEPPEILIEDVLGRLGHINLTLAREVNDIFEKEENKNNDSGQGVPPVPNDLDSFLM